MVDRLLGSSVIAFGVAYLYVTVQLPVRAIGDPVGPRVFPFVLGAATLVVGAMILIAALRRTSSEPGDDAPEAGQFVAVALVSIWTAVFFLALEPVGFAISCALFLLGLTGYFNRRRWAANVAFSLLFAGGVYGVFTRLLHVPLARGVLPF